MKRFLLGALLLPATVFAQVPTPTRTPTKTPTPGAELIWDHPTKRMDGSDLKPDELKETRIYNKRSLYKVIPYPTNVAAITMSGSQNYAWEATAVDKTGLQSDYSNALVFQATPVPTLAWPPTEPGSLRVK